MDILRINTISSRDDVDATPRLILQSKFILLFWNIADLTIMISIKFNQIYNEVDFQHMYR